MTAKTIKTCLDTICELSAYAVKMRSVVENTRVTEQLKYQAIVTEESLLQLINRYIDRIDELKLESINDGTTDNPWCKR